MLTSIKDHWLSVCGLRIAHFISLYSLLYVVNNFENTLLGEASRFFLSVPIRDLSTQIHSHDLLDKCSNYFEVFVVNGAHSNKVDIDDAKDVSTDQPRMLLYKLFIPESRAYELVFSGLAPFDLVVRVDERSIINANGHLISLVHNLKITVPVYGCDFHFFFMQRHSCHICLKIIDKLLRKDVQDANFANVKCNSVAFPDLMLHKTVLLIMVHYWYFSLTSN